MNKINNVIITKTIHVDFINTKIHLYYFVNPYSAASVDFFIDAAKKTK